MDLMKGRLSILKIKFLINERTIIDIEKDKIFDKFVSEF